MSRSSATSRIVCISNGTTYSPYLQCSQGDLNQFYDDTGTAFPKFSETNAPKMYFFAYSSEDSGSSVKISDENIVWEVNSVTLAFSGGKSTNSFNGDTGHFVKEITTLDGEQIQTLKIVKDLININNKSSFNIKALGTIRNGNTSVTLPAIFPVTIAKGEVGSRKVRIQSPAEFNGKAFIGKPFTISKKQKQDDNGNFINIDGSYTLLEAVVITSSANADSTFSYKWYKQVSGEWVDTNLTSKIIIVSNPDVEGSALYKVVVYEGSGDGAKEYGSDIQNVNDVSDPYQVHINCVDSFGAGAKPAVEVSYKGSGVPIRYAPYVTYNGDETRLTSSKVKFMMTLTNAVGTILNNEANASIYNPPFKNTDKKDNFEIPEKFITDNNGVDLLIEAEISDGKSA